MVTIEALVRDAFPGCEGTVTHYAINPLDTSKILDQKLTITYNKDNIEFDLPDNHTEPTLSCSSSSNGQGTAELLTRERTDFKAAKSYNIRTSPGNVAAIPYVSIIYKKDNQVFYFDILGTDLTRQNQAYRALDELNKILDDLHNEPYDEADYQKLPICPTQNLINAVKDPSIKADLENKFTPLKEAYQPVH